VTVVRDLRFYRHRHTRRLTEFTRLEVDVLTVSSNPNRSGRSSFEVELTSDDHKDQVVGLFDDADAALAHGRRLSSLLGLPVEDYRYTERPADE